MAWKVLSSEYIYKDFPLMTLRKDRLLLPNGNIIDSYYVLEYPPWVTVLAITKQKEFVMINQYRHGLGLAGFELPAGGVDDIDSSPLEGAKRELMEETGYGGGHWQEWLVNCANPSTNTNFCYCFLATDVDVMANQSLEPTEIISVHLMKESEVKKLLLNNEIHQALHTSALWKYFSEKNK